jgi:hypothetical protein
MANSTFANVDSPGTGDPLSHVFLEDTGSICVLSVPMEPSGLLYKVYRINLFILNLFCLWYFHSYTEV